MLAENDVVTAEVNLRPRSPDGNWLDDQPVVASDIDSARGFITALRQHVDAHDAASFFEKAPTEPTAGEGATGSPQSGPNRLSDR